MQALFKNIGKCLLLTLFGFSFLLGQQRVSAQQITITNASWSTLQSDLTGGFQNILLHFNGTISPPPGSPLEIYQDTTIDATGYNVVLGGSASQIFTVDPGVNFTLINVTLAHATNTGAFGTSGTAGGSGGSTGGAGGNGTLGTNAFGGAVYNQGNSTFIGCSFISNSVAGGAGGIGGNGGNGVGTLSTGGNGGGGGNGGIAYGGAIYNLGTLLLSNCTVAGNVAIGGAGASGGTNGTGNFPSYPGSGGAGGDGWGAGIYSLGIARIVSSTLNQDSSKGGAASQWGGGIPSGTGNGATGPAGGSGYGGGLYNAGTNVLINCTLAANSDTGANGGKGGNDGANGGFAGNGGNGGNAKGGGIYNAGFIAITNCTFANGVLTAGTGGAAGSGTFAGSPGSTGSLVGVCIYNASGTFDLKNSILAYSTPTNLNAGGTITDQGNNISSDSTPSFGTNSHNSSDPLLASLGNYGGPTLTMAVVSGSPAINAGDNSATPVQDQRGYYWTGTSTIGAYEYGGVVGPTIQVYPAGPHASEDGDIGMFFIVRSATGPTGSMTINYVIAGTATNGSNYTLITNSATIPSGLHGVPVLVSPIANTYATNFTVTLTLSTNSQYVLDTNLSAATVILYPKSTFDPAKRFVRGSSTAPDFQSFVIPLDAESGVPLAASGGNATALFPSNPWTTNFYHFNATNLSSQNGTNGRIGFQNPIVAFGSPVGGSPLYLNRNYNFGVFGGTIDFTNLANALRIQVYYRSNSALAGTINLTVPNPAIPNQDVVVVSNGFTETFGNFGLQTTALVTDYDDWGLFFGVNYVLTHTASSEATNYYYVVEEQGFAPDYFMVVDQSGNPAWSKLYAMEFSPFPANRSTFVDEPQFNGIPLPPMYQGMSVPELTNVAPTLPNLSALVPTNYLTIDASPELRRHPTLDQFVKDMGGDPLALANYVINEINLTDPIDYDTNYNSQPSITPGGVNRGALATFQEGQGSPLEQCALLVYLLRQAGVPATYIFPTNNGLQMLDFQVSKLLQVQLHGALDTAGQTNMPQLISVNYPWVAAYVNSNWVQIFPWLKDTEITEGWNLYDYMPSNYNSGYKWLTHFIAGDTNIFSLSSSDQPLDLLPLFIQQNLDSNFPGVSVDDLGVQVENRRHLYARWSDFPKPFALSGSPTIVESLSTNLNLFNTMQIVVFSQANTNKYIDTSEMRVMDFHDRKLLLKFVQVGTSNLHNMVLTLSPYATNITSQRTFDASADSTWTLSTTNQLNTSDDNIIFQVTRRRDKFLPSNFNAPSATSETNLWGFNYSEQGLQQWGRVYQFSDTFRKGDLVAFCLDVGQVSQKMLNVQAQEIWRYNQTATTNNANLDIYAGTVSYLMGMSYFNYMDRFSELNNRLHKVRVLSAYEHGFGLIRPERDGTGALTNNGQVILLTPAIHMPDNGQATVFNASVRPDLGQSFVSSTLDWWLQLGLQNSAAEHGILRGFYQTNAISAVKLLQQAGTNAIALNISNFVAMGTNLYHGVPLKSADTNLWNTIAGFLTTNDYDREVFITPGTVTNGSFVGVGALLFSDFLFSSPVSGLNGGFLNNLPDIFTTANSPFIDVVPAPDGSTSPYSFVGSSSVNNPAAPVDGSTAPNNPFQTYANLVNGQQYLDPALQGAINPTAQLFGSPATSPGLFNQFYNNGSLDTTLPYFTDTQQLIAEPVNVMTGEFYVDAVDLTLPGPMSLQVRRNYSSQNLAENQFGFGWKMNYMPFLSVGTNSVLIYAAEMDGSVVAYRQTSTNANLWLPTTQDNPTLNNNSSFGIGSVANLFNNTIQLSAATGTNVYTLTGADGSIRMFSQQSFPIGTFTRQRPYLNTWQDNRGNSYSFQYGTDSTQPDYGQLRRIQSSNGNFTGFYFDDYGHIIEAYTGDGRILEYDYDEYGDLITVTLPDESEINYVYQHANMVTNSVTNVYSTHLIQQELKPNGRIVQNAYDSQRRVTNQMSTVGSDLNLIRTATFAYTNNFSLSSPTNQLAGVTAVYDYTNSVTSYAYTNSLIQQIVDPLNHTNSQSWYGAATNGGYPRSLKSRTDKRGLTTAYQYDAFGNVTNTTVTGDLLGNGNTNDAAVSSATYNTNNLPLQITDAVSNQTQFIYSTTYPFLPQQAIKLAGTNPVSTNFFIYTNANTVVANGTNTTTNASFGLLARTIRAYNSPDAATNDLFYNGQGFVTNSVAYTGNGDPSVVSQLFYNERGELAQRTDAAGRSYTFMYDPMGRLAGKETFDIGQSNPMDWEFYYYNENGEMNWIDGPRYNPEDYVFFDYDGAGRKSQEIHWRSRGNMDGSGVSAVPGYGQFATTFYQYDPLGDLTQITDPLGDFVTQGFDAIGQLIKQVSYASNGTALATNLFAYEPGGLVSSATNALGGITTKLYNWRGQPEFQSNPDGSTNGWRYDLSGRAIQEFSRNGCFWQTTYDDLNLKVTRVYYSGTTPLAANIAQIDHRGNVIQTVDANGNVHTNLFDGLDRLKVVAGPPNTNVFTVGMSLTNFVTNVVQEVSTYFYDGSGQVLTVSNALGEITVTTNDALGRPIQVSIYPSNSVTPVRVVSSSYNLDHNSVTVTSGTGTNAIVRTSYTDTDGRPLLTLGFPTNGVCEFTWWQYDVAGNRIAQQQCSSNSSGVTVWATNGWTYDGLDRVLTETSRDGVTTTNSYDALGDVINRAMPSGLTWSGTYLNDGRIFTEMETGGALTARTNLYTYFGSNTPLAGLLQSRVDGRGTLTTNIQYDSFLRMTNLHTQGILSEQDYYRHLQYDPVGNLVYAYDEPVDNDLGFQGSVSRIYDAYNRISSEIVGVGYIYYDSSWGVSQTWDAAGRRNYLQTGIGLDFAYRADGLMTQAGGSTFSYGNNGLLVSRSTGAKTVTINQRDGVGRVLTNTTTLNLMPVLTENLSWRNDGRLSSYTANRDFTDTRSFSYSSLANRITQESFSLSSGHSATNTYTIDNNASGGLGILTSAATAGSASNSWSVLTTNGLDGLSRVAQAQDSLMRRSAIGTALGASKVSATLDGNPLNVQFDGDSVPYAPGFWRADMDLSPGSHTLAVSAVDATGFIFGSTNSTFSVATNAGDIIQNTYDGNGNIAQRVWVNSLGQTNRTQTLTWDAFDRLIKVTQRDSSSNGFNWSAGYDPLGRRLGTVFSLVLTNTPVDEGFNPAVAINSWFDPQAEFEEVGVKVNDTGYWKTLGPDINGVYGGMLGVGGVESVLQDGHLNAVGVVQDYFGNVLGTIANATVSWSSNRVSSYGPVPGYQPPALSPEVGLAQSLGWRGKRVDETGLIYLGARHYDSTAGRFLSADPLGHSASMDLYSFCDGDPVNRFDPDGRMNAGFYRDELNPGFWRGSFESGLDLYGRTINGILQTGAVGSDMIGQTTASMFGYGAYYQGYSQLYQNIYNNPSTGPTSGQILGGTLQAEINIGTLGAYGMAQGTYNGIQTGNWNQAQDASLNALLLSGGTRVMQSQGVNPWSVGYVPNAADNALMSLFKNSTPDTQLPVVNTPTSAPNPQTEFTQADVDAAIARLKAQGIQTSDVQSSIDPNQVIAIAKAMQSGAFKNGAMDSPVIFDPESQAYLAGNHRAIAAEMTGFNLQVTPVPNSVPNPIPFSSVPLQTGRVNPPIKVQ